MPSYSNVALFILVAFYHLTLGAPVPGRITASEVDGVHAGTDGDASGGSANGVNNTNRPYNLLGDALNKDGLINLDILSGSTTDDTGKSENANPSLPLIDVKLLSGTGARGGGSNPSSLQGHKWVFPRRPGSQGRYN